MMAQMVRRAAAWLGLVSDDHDEVYGEDVEQFSEPIYRAEDHRDETVITPINRNLEPAVRSVDLSRIVTMHPSTYNDARTIGEHYRDGYPVIMDLSDLEREDAKRLVDFAAGLTFGTRGTIERVTSKVFLLSPPNVNVTAEDKERIKGGFYNQS